MVHDHVDSHTVNGDRPMGGIMTVIPYEEIDAKKQDFYDWKDKKIVPDFYYEESMTKPYGIHYAAIFMVQAIQFLWEDSIGRGSCRERVCQYVYISVGAVAL